MLASTVARNRYRCFNVVDTESIALSLSTRSKASKIAILTDNVCNWFFYFSVQINACSEISFKIRIYTFNWNRHLSQRYCQLGARSLLGVNLKHFDRNLASV